LFDCEGENLDKKERERNIPLFAFFSKIFVKEQNAPPLCWIVFFFPFRGEILLEQLTDFSFLSSLFNDANTS